MINSIINVVIAFFGSMVVAWNILLGLDFHLLASNLAQKTPYRFHKKRIVAVFYLFFIIINLIQLFLCNYPGILTSDSLDQVGQILTGTYSNHHPFWHTMIIRQFITFGSHVFGSITAGVACYSVFQIVFMAACFAFCIETMYQLRIQEYWVLITMLYFLFMPYHISYSISMWKDVPFGGAVLVFLCALSRMLYHVEGKKWINWVALIFGGFGVCLWRTNGWYAFALTLILFFIFYFAQEKKIAIVLVLVFSISYILLHPVLAFWGIRQPDTIESLSIPAQQIARVIADGGQISDSENSLLKEIVYVEQIPETYSSYISDPIKNLVRKTDNQSYLKAHKWDYLKLWLSIGLKNPAKYVEAWIDQTKGYWNAGYEYWIYADGIEENEYDIERSIFVPTLNNIKNLYFHIFDSNEIFEIFQSIGLCTWILTACFFVNMANNRGKAAFLIVPLFSIIATLLIATPVFSEFRYAYALFTCLPLSVCTTFCQQKGENENG